MKNKAKIFDYKSDVYSLGVIMYFLICQEMPN